MVHGPVREVVREVDRGSVFSGHPPLSVLEM